jgi:hypothetical protein
MTREKFLTVRWNNWLSLGLGLPTLIYGVVVLSISVLSDFASFIGIVVMGVVYCTVVEVHSNLRFKWLRKNSADPIPAKLRFFDPLNLIFLTYNIVYWIPIILPFTAIIDYRMGFIVFFLIIIIRGIANSYRNNFLEWERAEIFPLRIP